MEHATPNLPSRKFAETSAFYAKLGFAELFKDDSWMILKRGDVMLEFFPHPKLKPATSWYSCCMRLHVVDGFFDICMAAGIPDTTKGWPRFHPPTDMDGMMIGALIDPDGSLIRVIQI